MAAIPAYEFLPAAMDDDPPWQRRSHVSDPAQDAREVAAEDAELVARLRVGDVHVFEIWYKTWLVPLWRFARQFGLTREIAQDVVQDVFMSIWSRRESLTFHTTAAAYLYGAVRYRAMREHRHTGVVRRTETLLDGTGNVPGMGEGPSAPDASLTSERIERREAVVRAVQDLPERQRLALTLWFEHERTTIEIAEVMGVSERAVRKLLEKARAAVRAALVQNGRSLD